VTSDGTAGVHPDLNALADLAADVLPVDEARTVEAHVISCPDCADLLADSERIRPLLLADDIGPMPDEVWARISGTLAEEASARSALQGPPVPVAPVPAPSGGPWDDHWSVHEDVPGVQNPGRPTTSGSQTRPGADDGLAAAAAAGPGAGASVEPAAGSDTGYGRSGTQDWLTRGAEQHGSTRRDDPFGVRAGDEAPTGPSRFEALNDGGPSDDAAADRTGRTADGTVDGPVDDPSGYTRVSRSLADLTPASAAERTGETGTLPALAGTRVSGLRPGRRSGPSRRDVRDSAREESGVTGALRKVQQGAQKGVRSGRRGTVLAVAAGVVVAAGLGGVVWSVVGDQFGSAADSAAGGAAGPAPAAAALAPVLSTDRNYTEGKLAADAKALVAKAKTGADGAKTSFASGAQEDGATREASIPAAAPEVATGAEALAQPAVLAACLDALDAADQRPLAVDIARYAGREAAIIVLQGEDGGLEVWAVSRDCGSGNEVPLTFLSVPK
jgi:hypothetical protein